MSFESYINNSDILHSVAPFKEPLGKRSNSIVGAFASMMITDATAELVSINRQNDGTSPMSSLLTVERPGYVTKRTQTNKKELFSMLYLGSTLISIEDIIATGYYDHASFLSPVNFAFGNIGKYKEKQTLEAPERMDSSELRMLAQAAERDKTLTSIVENHYAYLPEKMLDELEKKEMQYSILQLLPDYTEVMTKLLEQTVTPVISGNEQATILELFDNQFQAIINGMKNDPLILKNRI